MGRLFIVIFSAFLFPLPLFLSAKHCFVKFLCSQVGKDGWEGKQGKDGWEGEQGKDGWEGGQGKDGWGKAVGEGEQRQDDGEKLAGWDSPLSTKAGLTELSQVSG